MFTAVCTARLLTSSIKHGFNYGSRAGGWTGSQRAYNESHEKWVRMKGIWAFVCPKESEFNIFSLVCVYRTPAVWELSPAWWGICVSLPPPLFSASVSDHPVVSALPPVSRWFLAPLALSEHVHTPDSEAEITHTTLFETSIRAHLCS